MEEFCRLTNIPLETSRQDGPASATRPPWIRPVRKKAPSIARSNQSGDSPSHHSSPEAFSPSEFFSEPTKPAFSSGPPSSSGATPSNQVTSPPQYTSAAVGTPPQQAQQTNNSTFMDTSGGLGMDSLMREDPSMYMSHEMMALFNDGGVDVQHLFAPEFMHPQPQQQQAQQQQLHHQSDLPGNPTTTSNNHTTPSTSFANPTFLKRNGLATSP